MDFYLLLKVWVKVLEPLNLKLIQKKIQKNAETAGELTGSKVADKIRMIQKQLQMSMIEKYINKDIYLQKNNRKLLMN